ncbi:MAG: RNA 3'-terminal phosphate cyclase [Blastocatellia bacterium]|nr:RNA 3'-terminal phosphate cyclase [Blastocatellia bacterium]
MITIDGSFGEGGGQILRTSLALSLVTGQPFRIEKIRAGRKNPGLLRQHLTAVKAATEIGQAEVKGNVLGSTQLTFTPGAIKAGDYAFAVGTAGSATLVLQTVLPALLQGNGETTTLTLEGGTHNPFAPPFDFLVKAFLPIINRMGAGVAATIERHGFYPAGGGKFVISINPTAQLGSLELVERGDFTAQVARAIVAHLPFDIAERELSLIGRKMDLPGEALHGETIKTSPGPGNAVTIELTSQHVTEVFTGFGERGVSAEAVANSVVKEAREYIAAEVVAGEYLADQLLLPFALARGGAFTTLPLSKHSTTNMDVIQKFLDVKFEVTTLSNRAVQVEVR